MKNLILIFVLALSCNIASANNDLPAPNTQILETVLELEPIDGETFNLVESIKKTVAKVKATETFAHPCKHAQAVVAMAVYSITGDESMGVTAGEIANAACCFFLPGC